MSAASALKDPAYSVTHVPPTVSLPIKRTFLAAVSNSVWLVKLLLCRLCNSAPKVAPADPFRTDSGIFTHCLPVCPVSAGALK